MPHNHDPFLCTPIHTISRHVKTPTSWQRCFLSIAREELISIAASCDEIANICEPFFIELRCDIADTVEDIADKVQIMLVTRKA